MPNFIRVEATRDNGVHTVFNEENEFRMNVQIGPEKGFGAHNGVVFRDLDRFLFIGSDDDIRAYERQLSRLDGQDYVQGDLFGASELAQVLSKIQMEGLERCTTDQERLTAKPPLLGFGYLRKDGTMGAASITFDSATNNLSIVIVNYPQDARSFSAANVNYFFPEALANDILSDRAKRSIVSESIFIAFHSTSINIFYNIIMYQYHIVNHLFAINLLQKISNQHKIKCTPKCTQKEI